MGRYCRFCAGMGAVVVFEPDGSTDVDTCPECLAGHFEGREIGLPASCEDGWNPTRAAERLAHRDATEGRR